MFSWCEWGISEGAKSDDSKHFRNLDFVTMHFLWLFYPETWQEAT